MFDSIVNNLEYKPESSLLELCFKCNLNCKHCGSSLNAYKGNRKGNPLSLQEFCNIIDELKNLGGKRIGLVGGEPLLYEHWREVAQYACEKGFYVSMISNGMLIDEKMAEEISKCGIKLVALSLDGPQNVHNELRGHPNAYNNVLRAIRALKLANVQVNIITTIMKNNLALLPAIHEILVNSGISFWQLQIGIPMGKLGDHTEYVIAPEELRDVENFILSAKEKNLVQITVADSIGYCSKNEILLRNNSSTYGDRVYLGCMAGCKAVAIESNGNVKGCLSLQNDYFIEGNIRERSLTEIWNDNNSFQYNRNFDLDTLTGDCKTCKYGSICRGGCTTLAYNTSGKIGENKYCLYRLEKIMEE